jgi:hypothetical protein
MVNLPRRPGIGGDGHGAWQCALEPITDQAPGLGLHADYVGDDGLSAWDSISVPRDAADEAPKVLALNEMKGPLVIDDPRRQSPMAILLGDALEGEVLGDSVLHRTRGCGRLRQRL